MLKTQEKSDGGAAQSPDTTSTESIAPLPKPDFPWSGIASMDESAYTTLPPTRRVMNQTDDSASWDLIGLGTEEPLPTQEAQNDLYAPINMSWL
jgi:hypothetical protein